DAKQTVHVDGGGQRIVTADLLPIQKGPTIGEIERSQREQSSWGATTLPGGRFNVDVGAGYAWFLEARLIAGIAYFGPENRQGLGFGLDVGVDLRSNLYDTQVGLRPRVQILEAGPFAFGVDLAFL